MQARFFCKTGELAGSEFRIGDEATIGRGSRSTIVLKADAVSKAHARIAFDGTAAAYFLEDLDSTNGTRLDGVPVSQRQRLSDLHVVTLGKRHDFIFVAMPDDVGERGGVRNEEQAAPAAQPAAPATRYEPPPSLDLPSFQAEPRQNAAKSSFVAMPDDVGERGGVRNEEQAAPAAQPAAPATRYEPPPPLDLPSFQAEPRQNAAKSSFVAMPDDVGERGSVRNEEQAAPAAQPAAPATRYEPPPPLDLPSFQAEPRQNAAKSSGAVPGEAAQPAGGMDGPPMSPAEPASRHEPAPVLDVPPLRRETGPAEGKGGGFALDEATLIRDPKSEHEVAPPESVTRHRSPPAIDVPLPGAPPTPAETDGRRAGREANASLVTGQDRAAPVREAATADESPTLDFPQLDARPSPSSTVIEIRIADGAPRRMALDDGRHVVGRGKGCAVHIDDATLSRRHAAFVVLGDRMTVVDLDSRNGTFFDEAPVESATEVALGRTVTFGNRVRVVRIEP